MVEWLASALYCRHHNSLLFIYFRKGPCEQAVTPEDEFCGWNTWVLWCPCLQHGAYGGGSYGWEVTEVRKWGGVCHMRLCLWPHVHIIRGKDSALSLLGQVTAWQSWHRTTRQQWIQTAMWRQETNPQRRQCVHKHTHRLEREQNMHLQVAFLNPLPLDPKAILTLPLLSSLLCHP